MIVPKSARLSSHSFDSITVQMRAHARNCALTGSDRALDPARLGRFRADGGALVDQFRHHVVLWCLLRLGAYN